ncbi:hypothetical protein [uncultured Microbacterium sp.]|uniref:hypothetical protein n=1 Tax=uncultured Microbacterium sp. TaxID=191216 RepID=UPI0035C98BF6
MTTRVTLPVEPGANPASAFIYSESPRPGILISNAAEMIRIADSLIEAALLSHAPKGVPDVFHLELLVAVVRRHPRMLDRVEDRIPFPLGMVGRRCSMPVEVGVRFDGTGLRVMMPSAMAVLRITRRRRASPLAAAVAAVAARPSRHWRTMAGVMSANFMSLNIARPVRI